MIDFLTYELTAQAVGVIASAFIVIGYLFKSDITAKKIIVVGSVLFALHFFMIGAMTAMMMNFVNIFRVGLSIKFHKSKLLFSLFVIIYIVTAIFTFQTWVDIFPLVSSILGCICMYFLSGIVFRSTAIVGTLCWLTHNIVVLSWGGILTEIFVLSAHLSTIWRLKADKTKQSKNDQISSKNT